MCTDILSTLEDSTFKQSTKVYLRIALIQSEMLVTDFHERNSDKYMYIRHVQLI